MLTKRQLLNLLLVEDNPSDAFLFEEELRLSSHHEFNIIHVDRLTNALEILETHIINIILLDLSLPDSQGIDTLLTIQDHFSAIPIVILSNLNDEEVAMEAVKKGAQDYLVKGKVTGYLLVRSIHYAIERKYIQLQLELTNQELQHSNEELEAFNYSVSHDLRNPLTSMNGFLWLLQKYHRLSLNEEGKHYLDRVEQAIQKMKQIIDNLLLFSRVQRSSLDLEIVNLSNLCYQISQDLKGKYPDRDVTITIQGEIIVNCDRKLMEIVLDNLLQNAWKYTGKMAQGKIEICTCSPTDQLKFSKGYVSSLFPELLDKIHRDNKRIVYAIQDNGIGFNTEDIQSLFNPFKRLENALEFDGYGIGLATVKRILNRHGGSIACEGKLNHGAVFYFLM